MRNGRGCHYISLNIAKWNENFGNCTAPKKTVQLDSWASANPRSELPYARQLRVQFTLIYFLLCISPTGDRRDCVTQFFAIIDYHRSFSTQYRPGSHARDDRLYKWSDPHPIARILAGLGLHQLAYWANFDVNFRKFGYLDSMAWKIENFWWYYIPAKYSVTCGDDLEWVWRDLFCKIYNEFWVGSNLIYA